MPRFPSDYQWHYQLPPDRSEAKYETRLEQIFESNDQGEVYFGDRLKGKLIDPRQIFDWVGYPLAMDQWASQCSRPRKEGSLLCGTVNDSDTMGQLRVADGPQCEGEEMRCSLGLFDSPISGLKAPDWLRMEKRLIPSSEMII